MSDEAPSKLCPTEGMPRLSSSCEFELLAFLI